MLTEVENSGSSLFEREGTGNVWCSQSQEPQGEEPEAKTALRRKRPRLVPDSETSRFTSLCETMQSGKQCPGPRPNGFVEVVRQRKIRKYMASSAASLDATVKSFRVMHVVARRFFV